MKTLISSRAKIAMYMVAVTFLFVRGCVKEDDPTPTGNTTTPTTAKRLGTAQVTFFNGLNLQLNKSIEIYLDDPSKDNEEKLIKTGLPPFTASTVSMDVYEGVQNEITFYFKDPTRPSGLFRGKASGAFDLQKDGKYTIVIYGSNLESAVLLDNKIDKPVTGFSYVRGINLTSYGIRIKKSVTSGDADVDLNVGPFSDQEHFGDYKGFTKVLEGTHVVQAIDYINVHTSGGGLKKEFGSKAFATGKASTLIIITSADLNTIEFIQINHL